MPERVPSLLVGALVRHAGRAVAVLRVGGRPVVEHGGGALLRAHRVLRRAGALGLRHLHVGVVARGAAHVAVVQRLQQVNALGCSALLAVQLTWHGRTLRAAR